MPPAFREQNAGRKSSVGLTVRESRVGVVRRECYPQRKSTENGVWNGPLVAVTTSVNKGLGLPVGKPSNWNAQLAGGAGGGTATPTATWLPPASKILAVMLG